MKFQLILDDYTEEMDDWLVEQDHKYVSELITTYTDDDEIIRYKIKFSRKNDMILFKLTWGGLMFNPQVQVGQSWFYNGYEDMYNGDSQFFTVKRKVLAIETLPEVGDVVVFSCNGSRHIIQHRTFIQWIKRHMAEKE